MEKQWIVVAFAGFCGGVATGSVGFGVALTFNSFWFFADEFGLLDVSNELEDLVTCVSFLNLAVTLYI